VASIAALSATVPSAAEAQFGGLIKKAKAKIAPSSSPSGESPHFDAVTVELAPSQVDAMVRGLTASVNALGGKSPNGVIALQARIQAAIDERGSLEDSHPGERDRYINAINKISPCRDDAFGKIREQQGQQMGAKMMSDPSFRTAYMQSEQKIQAAAAKGDTVAAKAIAQDMFNKFMPITRADSAAVTKQCGQMPPTPAFIAREDSLDSQREQWDHQIRAMQEKAASAGYQAAGLTSPQFSTAVERIQYYVNRSKAGVAQRGFTEQELAALHSRESQLRALLDEYFAGTQ
jgi:hypothetical protein